jgi:hypothetical protein
MVLMILIDVYSSLVFTRCLFTFFQIKLLFFFKIYNLIIMLYFSMSWNAGARLDISRELGCYFCFFIEVECIYPAYVQLFMYFDHCNFSITTIAYNKFY